MVVSWLFAPKVLGGGRDLRIIILLKMNAVSVVVTFEVVGHPTTTRWQKKFKLCTLRGGGDIKTFQLLLELELELVLVLVLELELALVLAIELELVLVLMLELELELALVLVGKWASQMTD